MSRLLVILWRKEGITMKVLAINGSPRLKGNTYHALKLACDEL